MWGGLHTKVSIGNTSMVTFTSGQLAARHNVSPDTIRRYGQEGVVNPTRAGRIRIYTEEDDRAIALHRQRIAAKRGVARTVKQEIAAAV